MLNCLRCAAEAKEFSAVRKTPGKGYAKGNVWVISLRANLLRNNASRRDLEVLVERMKENGIG